MNYKPVPNTRHLSLSLLLVRRQRLWPNACAEAPAQDHGARRPLAVFAVVGYEGRIATAHAERCAPTRSSTLKLWCKRMLRNRNYEQSISDCLSGMNIYYCYRPSSFEVYPVLFRGFTPSAFGVYPVFTWFTPFYRACTPI